MTSGAETRVVDNGLAVALGRNSVGKKYMHAYLELLGRKPMDALLGGLFMDAPFLM